MAEALGTLQELERGLAAWETRRLLGGPYDEGGAVLSIYAGAGGSDAMDWAEMLQRMYTRWCEKRGYTTRVLDVSRGAARCAAAAHRCTDRRTRLGTVHRPNRVRLLRRRAWGCCSLGRWTEAAVTMEQCKQ
jgi:PCRF domain